MERGTGTNNSIINKEKVNMAINLKTTREVASDGVKVLVYGGSGSGKTTLIGTLPDPVIISAEAGLLRDRKSTRLNSSH